MRRERKQRGAVERPVVLLHPASYSGVDLPREAAHGVPGAAVQPPGPHFRTHLGLGFLLPIGDPQAASVAKARRYTAMPN